MPFFFTLKVFSLYFLKLEPLFSNAVKVISRKCKNMLVRGCFMNIKHILHRACGRVRGREAAFAPTNVPGESFLSSGLLPQYSPTPPSSQCDGEVLAPPSKQVPLNLKLQTPLQT